MKNVLFFFFTLFHVCLYSQQSIEGIWATYDDNTGKLESEVEIFIKNGKLYGKIIRLFDMDPNAVCSKCTIFAKSNRTKIKIKSYKNNQAVYNSEKEIPSKEITPAYIPAPTHL